MCRSCSCQTRAMAGSMPSAMPRPRRSGDPSRRDRETKAAHVAETPGRNAMNTRPKSISDRPPVLTRTRPIKELRTGAATQRMANGRRLALLRIMARAKERSWALCTVFSAYRFTPSDRERFAIGHAPDHATGAMARRVDQTASRIMAAGRLGNPGRQAAIRHE